MVPQITLELIASKINATSGFRATVAVAGDVLTVTDPRTGRAREFSRENATFEQLFDLEYQCGQMSDLGYFRQVGQ